MENIVVNLFAPLILFIFLFCWFLVILSYILVLVLSIVDILKHVLLFLFVPKKYSLKGEVIEIWEEKTNNFIPITNPLIFDIFESNNWMVNTENYQKTEHYLKIKNDDEEKILEIPFLFFNKIQELRKKNKKLFLNISCKEYLWANQIEILDLSA